MAKNIVGMGTGAMDTVVSCIALPKEDSFQIIKNEQTLPGGSCANMLAAFVSLGGSAKMIAKIGDDEYGAQFRKTLLLDGVDDRFLITKRGGVTLHTYVFAAENGEHSIFVNFGDSLMDLRPEEVGESMLDGADLYYSDLFPAAAAVKMAGLCRERGIPVVICMECPPSLVERSGAARGDILAALGMADLIISGREGYNELAGAENFEQSLETTYKRFAPKFGAVCTAGDMGAVWTDAQGTLKVEAYKIVPVDSTGAGDGFLGALLYSYFAMGSSRYEAMDFAAAVGAMKCLRFGPRIKTTPGEVFSFIEKHR
jgi:sugar/nucleoside kinase (ribokinase family)